MNERVLLVAPASNLIPQLESAGYQIITWPKLRLTPLENFAALDEAIANLYGYDWIIFTNSDAVRFFVERIKQQSREIGDLDTLRVCAISEATATALEHARVHVDVVPTETNPAAIIEQLATYAGGFDHLDRLNFLLPQAAIGRDYLKASIEDTGARADVVASYQTVANDELTRLTGLQSMLLTGSVDAVVFTHPDEVFDLARVLDTNHPAPLFRNTFVLAVGDATTNAAEAVGISQPAQANESPPHAITESLAKHFGV
ncbi:MAG TPA: uroporphyrinogen-III synthase [Pyrinomonadaceae bacterium]|nr:uroporphyrinogen-III synthase [Pyrinomonadaceae bacterium]